MSENIVYDDFYTELMSYWDDRGWAAYYYGVFSGVIKQNNFKKCAEVGIGYGFHAREILDNTNVETLYLIDPMTYYPGDGFVDDVIKYGGFEKLVKNIKYHLSPHSDRYVWFRQPSISISNEQIPDESLDAVFIDADHSYDAVTADLIFWWSKLRKGGWLLGDDYASLFPSTTAAVNDFASKNNLRIEFLSKPNAKKPGYPIYKFVKE